jgi:hypothetical protein
MDSIRNRAKKRFPTVLLTLLSIVQALALEFLWDHSRHRPELYEATASALIGWLQIAASLNVIILIWLAYAGMVMRFRWTPTTADSIWPFFVGLIQFQMIDLMGSDNLGRWLVVMAVLFGLMSVVNHHAMKRARLDKANSEFFDRFDPATFKDFVPLCVTVTVLIIAGGFLWNTDNSGWPAIVALLVTAIGLANEVRNAAKYWRVSMGAE